jgi:urea transport system substrate-binding protein
MRRNASLAFFAALFLSIIIAPALADKRVALVIGNGAYREVPRLLNPRNDAEDVAAALQRNGFETIVGLDLDKAGMEEKTISFARAARTADIAIFYYSGHALQYGGVNYLAPVDAKLIDEADLRRMTRVDEIVADLQQAKNLRILVLDSCRDNPLADQLKRSIGASRAVSIQRGLAKIDSPEGMIVSYATQAGRTASDGNGRNSPYTTAFLKHIEERDEIGTIFRRIAGDVYETTKREQLPELSLSFIGEFYLRGRLEIAVPVVPATPSTPDPCATASDHWKAADAIGSVAAFEDHLARFPNCTFAGLAKARIESLKEKLAVVTPPATPVAPPVVALPPVVRPTPLTNGSNTIKVGILHSLSGTMAISETTLKDVMLMLIDEQNKKGGLLGKKLEAVVVDPASNWPLFAEKARQLISKDKVAVVFGGWTSVSRKSVLPVFKELDSILFYPVQYEGEESERNVFYTGAAPNQQAIPAVDYLMTDEKVKRWVFVGTDYVYPRTTNKILEAYLKQNGVKDEDIMINYTPFGHSDWRTIVADIKTFGAQGKKTAVVSTINGDANVPFYKELSNQGIKASAIPVLALSIGEEELAGIDTKPLLGHLAAWNYFESIKNRGNEEFIAKWKAFTRNPRRVTNDPMEAHYIGFNMWVKAVDKVKSTDPDKVIDALPGIETPNLTGGTSKMLPNHHITKPAFVGEVRADGQFDVVWKTPGLVPGDAWSNFLPGSKDLEADWVTLKCGNYNKVTKKCGGVAFAR